MDELKACLTPFVSKTCEGERCHCGEPAVRKVGEEIPFDDPEQYRHNLTAYVCARHYAELMGPLGAKQVGITNARSTDIDVERVARALRDDLERQGLSLSARRDDGPLTHMAVIYSSPAVSLLALATAAIAAIKGE